jgi:hypothetical protein
MNNLEKEMIRQRHSRSQHRSQSHFLRNFPTFNMAHMAKSVIKPVTSTIHHISPLLSLLGGHTGKVVSAVSGIVDKLV